MRDAATIIRAMEAHYGPALRFCPIDGGEYPWSGTFIHRSSTIHASAGKFGDIYEATLSATTRGQHTGTVYVGHYPTIEQAWREAVLAVCAYLGFDPRPKQPLWVRAAWFLWERCRG